jgi:hypothetical protein
LSNIILGVLVICPDAGGKEAEEHGQKDGQRHQRHRWNVLEVVRPAQACRDHSQNECGGGREIAQTEHDERDDRDRLRLEPKPHVPLPDEKSVAQRSADK